MAVGVTTGPEGKLAALGKARQSGSQVESCKLVLSVSCSVSISAKAGDDVSVTGIISPFRVSTAWAISCLMTPASWSMAFLARCNLLRQATEQVLASFRPLNFVLQLRQFFITFGVGL